LYLTVGDKIMIPKMDTEAYLDQLLGVGRFSSLKDGLYVLKLFSGVMVDIVMYMTILRDGTVKTRVEVVNWGAIDNTVIHEETISRERACNIVQNQFYVASALTRVCNDLLEKAIGELSDIENSNVEGDIILDYQNVVSLGQFEVEVLYNRGEYDCTIYSMYVEPQRFYTKDIDRVESFLSEMKKKWDSTAKKVVEEELSKIGD
jgi:hypothetical protein